MQAVLMAMAAAMISLSFAPQLPSYTWVIAAAASLVIVCVRLNLVLKLVGLGVCAGIGLYWLLATQMLASQLPETDHNKTYYFSGYVDDIIQARNDREHTVTSFSFLALPSSTPTCQQLHGETSSDKSVSKGQISGRVKLTWVADAGLDLSWLSPGATLCLAAKLKRPRGWVNPVGLDYHQWLLANNYIATGIVRQIEPARVAVGLGSRAAIAQAKLRQSIVDTLAHEFSDPRTAATAMALSVGYSKGLSREDWQLLQHSGTVHLLVISGLHISLVAWLGFMIGGVYSRCVGLVTGRPHRAAAFLASVLFAASYAAVSGFALPSQRALIMVIIANVFWYIGWQSKPWLGYFIAVIVVIVLDPLAAHGRGFWLSFVVVALIILLLPSKTNRPKWVEVSRLQIGLFLGMLVPIGSATGLVSALTPLVNLVAIPFISMLVVPSLLLGLTAAITLGDGVVAQALLRLAGQGIELFWWLVGSAYNQDGFALAGTVVEVGVGTVSRWMWGLWCLAMVVALLAPISRWFRGLVAVLCAASLLSNTLSAQAPNSGSTATRLQIFDVGQGLSVVFSHAGKSLVFDTGPGDDEGFNAAEAVLAPNLSYFGTRTVDTLIVSHGDTDHSAGLEFLQDRFQLLQRYSGEPERLSIASRPCRAGQIWHWQDIRFEFLWPGADQVNSSANNRSCVLSISWADQSILLTGDIGKQVEWQLFEQIKGPVTVLLAPHHGSKSSSSHRFILAAAPEHVVFSAGYKNSYGHPATAIVERYRGMTQAQIWDTGLHGAITFQWRGSELVSAYGERLHNRRYWYDLVYPDAGR